MKEWGTAGGEDEEEHVNRLMALLHDVAPVAPSTASAGVKMTP